jgi:hypothetical protein
MLLEEAKQILKSNGYMLEEEFDGDIFMEIEDILEEYGKNPIEIQEIMQNNADLIAELVSNGLDVEEIVNEILN